GGGGLKLNAIQQVLTTIDKSLFLSYICPIGRIFKSYFFPISRVTAATVSGSPLNLQEMSMTIVYGGCIEPGGMKLDNEVHSIECPQCGQEASKHSWQRCEGSINHYWSVHCDHCGYRVGNDDDDDDDDRPPYPYELEGGPSYAEWVNEPDEPDDDFPGFWQEVGSEEPAVGPEPMTAICGPAKAEWMTRDDLIALTQGRPLGFS
ncbi:hypothetical protein P2A11_21435, partial [Xanthomonas perforans]